MSRSMVWSLGVKVKKAHKVRVNRRRIARRLSRRAGVLGEGKGRRNVGRCREVTGRKLGRGTRECKEWLDCSSGEIEVRLGVVVLLHREDVIWNRESQAEYSKEARFDIGIKGYLPGNP
ncbi:hypothetical protein R1flu_013276 [Riccia fluitans]|uniref:Uncharacterized protein n=1 Tax=Riccia fluitans TaxID=41844 RepID=A0ABD1YD53_9MARC